MIRKLFALLVVSATLALAQDLDVQRIWIHNGMALDSTAIPSVAPPQGQEWWFSRGRLGVFRMTNSGNVYRIDSVGSASFGDSARVSYEALNLRGYQAVTMLPMFGGDIDSSFITTSIKQFGGIQPDTVVIDSIKYTMFGGSSPSVVPKLYYGTDQSATGTAVITSPAAVTANNASVTVSSFNNGTVPKGSFLWMTFPTVTTKPWHFGWAVYGHYQ